MTRLKRLQAAANEEISQQLRRSLELMSGNEPKETTGRGHERSRGSEEGEAEEEDSSEQQEEDSQQKGELFKIKFI